MTRNDTGIDSCPRHLRLLFDYARQAAQLVESGEVSRESLGRSVVHQLAATKGSINDARHAKQRIFQIGRAHV